MTFRTGRPANSASSGASTRQVKAARGRGIKMQTRVERQFPAAAQPICPAVAVPAIRPRSAVTRWLMGLLSMLRRVGSVLLAGLAKLGDVGTVGDASRRRAGPPEIGGDIGVAHLGGRDATAHLETARWRWDRHPGMPAARLGLTTAV